MRNLTAAIYFLLALFGCDSGGTTMITRTVSNGAEVIHARTRIKAGIARFECLASASGECHYTLFPVQCASATDNCTSQQIDHFAMKAGETREIIGLPGFKACVAQDGTSMPNCDQ